MVPSQYIPVLQKLAGTPDYKVDSRERALEEVDASRKDSKETLGKLFKNTSSVERHQTKMVDKALPKKVEKDTGNPLLKVAMQTAHYRAVTRLAFKDELEKIAAA